MFTKNGPPSYSKRITIAALTATVLGALVLTGCSSGGGASSSGSSVAQADEAAGGSAPSSVEQHEGSMAKESKAGTVLTDGPRYKVKKAQVGIRTSHVGSVIDKVRGIADGVGGSIASEETYTNEKGQPRHSRLVVRVPVDTFESALTQISKLGDLTRRSQQTKDVTTKVVDINSRVENAKSSIQQLRTLYSEAKKIGDILRIENDLHEREADLESLQAQQRALQNKTTMSEITVSVEHTEPAPSKTDNDERAGFLAGISKGWTALKATAIGFSHVLGLVLPLGLLVLALAAGVFVVVRRVRARVQARPGN